MAFLFFFFLTIHKLHTHMSTHARFLLSKASIFDFQHLWQVSDRLDRTRCLATAIVLPLLSSSSSSSSFSLFFCVYPEDCAISTTGPSVLLRVFPIQPFRFVERPQTVAYTHISTCLLGRFNWTHVVRARLSQQKQEIALIFNVWALYSINGNKHTQTHTNKHTYTYAHSLHI